MKDKNPENFYFCKNNFWKNIEKAISTSQNLKTRKEIKLFANLRRLLFSPTDSTNNTSNYSDGVTLGFLKKET